MGYLRSLRSAPTHATPQDACLEMFDTELDYVFATLRRMGVRPGDVEDLAQEVFLVLNRRWPTMDTSRPLRPYLFAIAYRIVCAHRRRRGREVAFATLEVEDEGAGPEQLLRTKESSRLLAAALERVPLRRRAVLILHELDDVPVADIAGHLSLSQFGTYARLRKGRQELAAAVRRLVKEGG